LNNFNIKNSCQTFHFSENTRNHKKVMFLIKKLNFITFKNNWRFSIEKRVKNWITFGVPFLWQKKWRFWTIFSFYLFSTKKNYMPLYYLISSQSDIKKYLSLFFFFSCTFSPSYLKYFMKSGGGDPPPLFEILWSFFRSHRRVIMKKLTPPF